MAVDDRLAELNPKTRTCVVLGGGGFLGRSLVLRLLKLGKWIVRVADSAHFLRLDPSSECDSVLSDAISSGRLSYYHVDVRHKSSVCGGIFFLRNFLHWNFYVHWWMRKCEERVKVDLFFFFFFFLFSISFALIWAVRWFFFFNSLIISLVKCGWIA